MGMGMGSEGTIALMEMGGVVTMVVVLGGIWGGFAYFLYRTLQQDD